MRFAIEEIRFFERDVRLRLPFRFGVITLTAAPQAFVQARIRLENGRGAEGAAAELMVPKWFDKDPALSNEQNIEQLRASLRAARDEYLESGLNTAFGHSRPKVGLVENFGPALIDRAVLDALCRGLGITFAAAVTTNLIGAADAEAAFLRTLKPQERIAARHTVGLIDPLSAADARERVNDGLPETLEEVLARYGHRYFKLKVAGEVRSDVERLTRIAAVLDRIQGKYFATLDGNEQFDDAAAVVELWRRIEAEPRLKRLRESILFLEQPIARAKAGRESVAAIPKPVIIDESDDSLDAFPRARALGYRGVSSKTCKGLYKALINSARCAAWGKDYFMSGEDLTIQAGLALQQDLALVSLLGLSHVERNGHHYVNGMAGLPESEQAAFLAGHPDLYERSHGAVRVKIERGNLKINSLNCNGYASSAMPDWSVMRGMK